MKKDDIFYYVDVPDYIKFGEWRNLTTTKTREEAERFLLDNYGITADRSAVFIVEGSNL